VGLHRFLAVLAYHFEGFGSLIKGKATVLAEEGQLLWKPMRQNETTEKELMEDLSEGANSESMDQAE